MAKCLVILSALVACTFAFPRSVKIDPNGSWRVVGGENAGDGQYPYQISMKYGGSHSCGGSILNEYWVLTAAHCVDGVSPSYVTVVTGTNKLNSGGDSYGVANIVPHPYYDSWNIVNDIALIQLSKSISFNSKVEQVELERGDVGGQVPCVLSGWGTTSYPGSIPNDLQHINLRTITVSECKNAHSGSAVGETQVCTFTKAGEGACHGDSGGPLVRTDTSNRKQIGVVSWGTPCARGNPDVFTRVSSFTDWINSICGCI